MATESPAPAEVLPLTAQDTITIIGVGDMMLGTLYPPGHLPPNDGKDLLASVKHILKNANITFGNCEGTFLDSGGEMKSCSNPAICYAFRMPERYVHHFVDAGFNLISIANNHVGDFGETGRKQTAETLQKAGLHFAGLVTHPYTTFQKQGVKYGFCAFSPNTGCVDFRDLENAKQIVAKLDSACDIVIVSFHGGGEGAAYRHITRKTETYLGENRGNPYEFARVVIDAGADVVFGHGPHVPRAIDLYKNRFIIYSMGNFCTYSRFNLKGVNGIAPIIKVYVNKKGEFLKGKIYPVKQEGEGVPVYDSTNAAIKEITSLTKEDIPEAPLVISETGEIRKK